MKKIYLREFLQKIDERKKLLGLDDTPERTESLRNKGFNRTPEKIELLKCIEERLKSK